MLSFYIHFLYLNTIEFKARGLWGRVKIIIVQDYIKIGITLLTKHNYLSKN